MDFVYTWHEYRYWCKILFVTIPTSVYDLETKVTDLEICVKVLCLSFYDLVNSKSLHGLLKFGMVIDICANFYSSLSPPLLMT